MKIKINNLPIDIAEQLRLNNYYYIPKTTCAIYRADDKYYYFDTEKNTLGKGTYGCVYLASAYDLESKTANLAQKVAIKVLRPREVPIENEQGEIVGSELRLPFRSSIEAEIKFLRQYGEKTSALIEAFSPSPFPSSSGSTSETKINELPFYFFVMPYHDGKPLGEFRDNSLQRNPELSNLDFTQRTRLLLQAIMYLNLYHSNSPKTGGAILHNDLKPQNILLCNRIVNGKKEYYLWIGDYGKATETSDETTNNITFGTYVSAAPELLENKGASTRSDIFSFGMLCILIYNGINPYSNRIQTSHIDLLSHEANFEGFLDNLIPPGPFSSSIKKLLTTFIDSTVMIDVEARAGTEQCLRFLTLLNKYNQLAQQALKNNPPPLHDYAIIVTKLILINDGMWSRPSLMQEETFIDKENTQQKRWENFNFDENPAFCLAVSIIATRETISENRLRTILNYLSDSTKITAIMNAVSNKNLNYDTVNTILSPTFSSNLLTKK